MKHYTENYLIEPYNFFKNFAYNIKSTHMKTFYKIVELTTSKITFCILYTIGFFKLQSLKIKLFTLKIF